MRRATPNRVAPLASPPLIDPNHDGAGPADLVPGFASWENERHTTSPAEADHGTPLTLRTPPTLEANGSQAIRAVSMVRQDADQRRNAQREKPESGGFAEPDRTDKEHAEWASQDYASLHAQIRQESLMARASELDGQENLSDVSSPLDILREEGAGADLRVTVNPFVDQGGSAALSESVDEALPRWDGYDFDAYGHLAHDVDIQEGSPPAAPIVDLLLSFEPPELEVDDKSSLTSTFTKVFEKALDLFDDNELNKSDSAFLRKHFVDLLRFRGLFVAEVDVGPKQGCYAVSLPFATIAETVEELKLEMPLSGRVFPNVHGWWADKEDFISAHFSSDRTRVFAFVGFEKLGPTRKNGYRVDDSHPAIWRKLEIPDRERAFRTRIRQTCAVKVVGDVKIVPRRVSTIVLVVQYTDYAGSHGLSSALEKWRETRRSSSGRRASMSAFKSSDGSLSTANSMSSLNEVGAMDSQGPETLVRMIDFAAVNAIWNPLPSDGGEGSDEIETELVMLPPDVVFRLEPITGDVHPAFENDEIEAPYKDLEGVSRYRLVLMKTDGTYYHKYELEDKWVLIPHTTVELDVNHHGNERPYDWGGYRLSLIPGDKIGKDATADPVYPRLPYIVVAHALQQYGVKGVLVQTADDDSVNDQPGSVAFAARPGNCGVGQGPGSNYKVQCWYDKRKKSNMSCEQSTIKQIEACQSQIKEIKRLKTVAVSKDQKRVLKQHLKNLHQQQHSLHKKLHEEKWRMKKGIALDEVSAFGYYVNEGEPNVSAHSIKPMCIHCAAKYGLTHGPAPRRVLVPLSDPDIPLYLISSEELVIRSENDMSGRSTNNIHLIQELQEAQAESGDTEAVKIAVHRKEEPLAWDLRIAEDAESELKETQQKLIQTLRNDMHKAASIISGHDDGLTSASGSSSHAQHNTDKHDIRYLMVHKVFDSGFGPHDTEFAAFSEPEDDDDDDIDKIMFALAPDKSATVTAVKRAIRDMLLERLTPKVSLVREGISLEKCFPYALRKIDLCPGKTVGELVGDVRLLIKLYSLKPDGSLQQIPETGRVGEGCYAVIEAAEYKPKRPFARGIRFVSSAIQSRLQSSYRHCSKCGLPSSVDAETIMTTENFVPTGPITPRSSGRLGHSCACRGRLTPFNITAHRVDTTSTVIQEWQEWRSVQPLWSLRDYFGERVALYFSWVGALVSHLQILSVLGVIVFTYGLYNLISFILDDNDLSFDVAVTKLFDNEASAIFGILVCFWAAAFSEKWKRIQATWAHRWDVSGFEAEEEVRPQFRGEKLKPDPLTGDLVSYVPAIQLIYKLCVSYSMIATMVVAVIASVVAVLSFRLWLTAVVGGGALASIVPSVLDTVRIVVLGKIYDQVATKLTEFENHRTQTEFEDQLIIKLFLFQFINTYTTLFYVAFVRSRVTVFGLDDPCGAENSCMSQLSLQVLIQLVAKPAADMVNQNVVPRVLQWYKRRYGDASIPTESNDSSSHWVGDEMLKSPSDGFTASGVIQQEYSSKVILYGLVVLFAVAMPIAPIVFMTSCTIDIYLDSERVFKSDRRMHPRRAEDIGMWERIITLMNYVAIITNAFLLAFTSSVGGSLLSGSSSVEEGRLWFVVTFEHLCALLIFALSALYLDVPPEVRHSIGIKAKAVLLQTQDARDWIKHPKSLWALQTTTLANNDGTLLSRKVPDPMAYYHNFSELARPVVARRWGLGMLARSRIDLATPDDVLSPLSNISGDSDDNDSTWSPEEESSA